jgi:antitoxin component HigA of HigAB toxin-antitoxin module
MAEIERLWGAESGTSRGDRLDVLATLAEAYEAKRYPMDPPDPFGAILLSTAVEIAHFQRPRIAHVGLRERA